ncbi:hypothetical protein GCM10009799_00900 [Nocardiopsis rhodophaea]|uniref:Uncharacterized protein n=1 Tax=Nocardiopsis rhodophaea TaxID=280238 RepID=A0ABN2S360_9ACTN
METFPVLLLSGLVVGYFVLAGCDIGLGMLMPHLARTPAERRRLVAAIAPYFLGTEVWLVGAFGVVSGLFPALKGVLFEGVLWVVFAALLAAWLIRDTGLWLRARVDTSAWRSACDTAIVAGSWVLATMWGLVVGGLLAGGSPLSPFGLACAVTVTLLFLLRGAAFGAERLVPHGVNATGGAPSADAAARLTRLLSRFGVGTMVATAAVALVPGTGLAVDRPLALAAVAAVLAGALAASIGLSGPHLSRHTSTVAIGRPAAPRGRTPVAAPQPAARHAAADRHDDPAPAAADARGADRPLPGASPTSAGARVLRVPCSAGVRRPVTVPPGRRPFRIAEHGDLDRRVHRTYPFGAAP